MLSTSGPPSSQNTQCHKRMKVAVTVGWNQTKYAGMCAQILVGEVDHVIKEIVSVRTKIEN